MVDRILGSWVKMPFQSGQAIRHCGGPLVHLNVSCAFAPVVIVKDGTELVMLIRIN